MASILHLRLILQRFDDLMLWTTLPLERWKCHSLSSFFYPLIKRPWRAFFRFELRRLILICSRQGVYFDKGLLLFELRFCSFFYISFLLLFSFCLFFAMLLATLLALHEEYGI